MTGDPALSPTEGIGSFEEGLDVTSWRRDMALITMDAPVAHLMVKPGASTGYLELYRVCLQQQLTWIHIS